jgi:hypothetical protein
MRHAVHELPAVWGFPPETHKGENMVGSLEVLGAGEIRVRLGVWPDAVKRGGEQYGFVGAQRLQSMADDVERALAEDDGSAEVLLICGEAFPAAQVHAMRRIFAGLIEQLKEIGYGEI